MTEEFRNWSGSLRFRPEEKVIAESESQVQNLVREAGRRGRTVRVVGQGHSSTPLAKTEDFLLSLEEMDSLISVDRENCEAWIEPGITIEKMGEALLEHDLMVHNQGDVNVQQLGGAIGTGTHGTGRKVGNLSTMLRGLRMVRADGEVVEKNIENDREFIDAARVGLGTLGVFTALRVKLLPAHRLHRQEWCTGVDACMANLEELINENQHFDFYWYPRRDEVKFRTWNEPGKEPNPSYAKLVMEEEDWAPRVLSRTRDLRFDEMEYCLPFELGREAFLEVRQRMLRVHRKEVAWRTLYRTTSADSGYLSSSYGRETVTVSVHHNAGMEFDSFFQDLEPIFKKREGRPHWGKKHYRKGEALRELYPRWDDFQALRAELDPRGLFLSDELRELFGLREAS